MADRVLEHPILGIREKGRSVTFYLDGQELQGFEGEPIAMAIKAAGVMVHRYTQKEHKPRGVFCAIGRCTDCVMIVDGVPNIRTCITPLKEGMDVKTQYGVSEEPFPEMSGKATAYEIGKATADEPGKATADEPGKATAGQNSKVN